MTILARFKSEYGERWCLWHPIILGPKASIGRPKSMNIQASPRLGMASEHPNHNGENETNSNKRVTLTFL